jgi:hypothetical protein
VGVDIAAQIKRWSEELGDSGVVAATPYRFERQR